MIKNISLKLIDDNPSIDSILNDAMSIDSSGNELTIRVKVKTSNFFNNLKELEICKYINMSMLIHDTDDEQPLDIKITISPSEFNFKNFLVNRNTSDYYNIDLKFHIIRINI